MSCYRQYKSEIKDIDVMERALAVAGMTCKRNGSITTWGSQQVKTDLAVSEDAGKSFHFGFVKESNGNYTIHVEGDYVRKTNAGNEAAFVERMQTLYSYQMTIDGIVANDGLTVEECAGLESVYEKGNEVVLTVDVADHLLR